MTDTKTQQKCHCSLGLGAVILLVGLVAGVVNGFGLPHILAVIIGIILIVVGKKGAKFCQCCFGKSAQKKEERN